jgi:hypothetical protein
MALSSPALRGPLELVGATARALILMCTPSDTAPQGLPIKRPQVAFAADRPLIDVRKFVGPVRGHRAPENEEPFTYQTYGAMIRDGITILKKSSS